MRHAAFSLLLPFLILSEFSVHSASVYLAKMSSEESSDSEMPYDSSDDVWEKEEVSGDDESDGGPGFSAPTRRAPGLHVVQVLCLHSSLSEIMTFLHVLIKNCNIIVLELIFMLAASVFKPEQYDLKDFTCEIYRNEWIGETDL